MNKLYLALILSTALAGTYFTGYKIGKSDEAKEAAQDIAEQLEATAAKTRAIQQERDVIATQFHQTTINLTEKAHALQERLKAAKRNEQRAEDMARGANLDAQYYRGRLDTFINGLHVINEAADCDRLPPSNRPAITIETPDGLLSYTVGIAIDRCEIAEQLNSLITVCGE